LNKRKDIHEKVLNASSKEELMAAYSEWAEKYDSDLLGEMGYVAPMISSKLLQRYVDRKDARILDAGCGTGVVGECLNQDGYSNLEGVDYSQQMLDKARDKCIYSTLNLSDLTKTLDINDNVYEAIICVGTFTCGHVGPEAFNELVRITKPGGYICFTVREQAYEEDDYRTKMRELENIGVWELQELYSTDYIQQEGSTCKVCLYKVKA
jgi:predicted TPR repeat methyltransferase